jgi:hypothetical protein
MAFFVFINGLPAARGIVCLQQRIQHISFAAVFLNLKCHKLYVLDKSFLFN